MEKIVHLLPVLEPVGLGLMLLSVVLGVLYLWLSNSTASWMAAKSPWPNRISALKPTMMATMLLGLALLTLTWVLSQAARHKADKNPPAAVALPAPTPTPTPTAAASRPLAADYLPQRLPERPPTPVAVPPKNLPRPAPPAAPAAAHVGKAGPPPAVRPEPPRPQPKTAIFSARCMRILEKAGSGEPLSAAEQQEMVSKCQ